MRIYQPSIILALVLLMFTVSASTFSGEQEDDKKRPSRLKEVKAHDISLSKTQQEKDDEARKALKFVEEVLHLNKDQSSEILEGL